MAFDSLSPAAGSGVRARERSSVRRAQRALPPWRQLARMVWHRHETTEFDAE